MASILPVTVRRFLGLPVTGPKPGFKRAATVRNGIVPITADATLGDINNLTVGHGVLIPAPCWQADHATINAAQVALRTKYPTRKFSVRTSKYKGGRQDMLVLRLA